MIKLTGWTAAVVWRWKDIYDLQL